MCYTSELQCQVWAALAGEIWAPPSAGWAPVSHVVYQVISIYGTDPKYQDISIYDTDPEPD